MLPFALAAAHGVRHCSFSICTQAPGYDLAATVKLITCAAPRGANRRPLACMRWLEHGNFRASAKHA